MLLGLVLLLLLLLLLLLWWLLLPRLPPPLLLLLLVVVLLLLPLPLLPLLSLLRHCLSGMEAVAEDALCQKGKNMASVNLERALRREVRVQSKEGGGSSSRRT